MIGCSCAASGLRMPTSSVRSSRYTGLPEVGVWGTERETMHALVERSQGVYIVADDLQVVNGHLEIPL
jgi:hypothetical protein